MLEKALCRFGKNRVERGSLMNDGHVTAAEAAEPRMRSSLESGEARPLQWPWMQLESNHAIQPACLKRSASASASLPLLTKRRRRCASMDLVA